MWEIVEQIINAVSLALSTVSKTPSVEEVQGLISGALASSEEISDDVASQVGACVAYLYMGNHKEAENQIHFMSDPSLTAALNVFDGTKIGEIFKAELLQRNTEDTTWEINKIGQLVVSFGNSDSDTDSKPSSQ